MKILEAHDEEKRISHGKIFRCTNRYNIYKERYNNNNILSVILQVEYGKDSVYVVLTTSPKPNYTFFGL